MKTQSNTKENRLHVKYSKGNRRQKKKIKQIEIKTLYENQIS